MVKILIADDEKLAVKYYTQLINWEYYGFEIIGTAFDGKEALRILEEKEPDIILTDIKMPVMDGIEFARKAREINPEIHILFITSYTDFNYTYSALKLGADDYIMKDLVNAEILIKKLLEIEKKITAKRSEYSYTIEKVIEEIFISGKIDDSKLEWLGERTQKVRYGKFYYLFIKQDTLIPPAVSFFDNEDLKTHKSSIVIELCRNMQDQTFQPISVFRDGNGVIVILKTKGNASDIDSLTEISKSIQIRCSQALHKTYSVFIESVPQTLTEAGKEFITSEERIQQKYFFDRSLIIEINSPLLNTKKITDAFDVSFVANCVKENEIAQANLYINNYFDKIKESRDAKAFDSVFYNCLSLFKKYGHGLHGIKSGKTFTSELTDHDKIRMFSIPEAMQWILDKLESLIQIKSEGLSAQYSKDTFEIIKYIINNYGNMDLDVENISKSIAMSTARTEVKFKNETGLTLIDYLNKYRIQKAMEMLENGDSRIYEISEKVGFASSQYFSKVFKKYTMLTPIEFRKRISNETASQYNI